MKLKHRLIDVLNNFLEPIRERRAHFSQDRKAVMEMVLAGTAQVEEVAAKTMDEVRRVMHLDYKKNRV